MSEATKAEESSSQQRVSKHAQPTSGELEPIGPKEKTQSLGGAGGPAQGKASADLGHYGV